MLSKVTTIAVYMNNIVVPRDNIKKLEGPYEFETKDPTSLWYFLVIKL